MDLGLSGKSVIVTGASRGIGLAVTRTLIDQGASVVAVSKSGSAELQELQETGRVHAVAADLTDPQAPATVVEATLSAFGRLDVLVNNVGAVRARVDGFPSVTDDDWETTFQINFFPPYA
jgi:NAD(P)-dependent dehydrogenase (short-subunit alcohol dehydrogenase family)